MLEEEDPIATQAMFASLENDLAEESASAWFALLDYQKEHYANGADLLQERAVTGFPYIALAQSKPRPRYPGSYINIRSKKNP